MKRLCIILTALAVCTGAFAQKIALTPVRINPVTPVKDQGSTPTCWAFSTLSFLESEAIRLNQLDSALWPDFSEMFVVEKSFEDRAVKEHILGKHPRAGRSGSESDDVIHVIADHGLVPEGAMKSLQGEMNGAGFRKMVKTFRRVPEKNPVAEWPEAFRRAERELGIEAPETFVYNGESYTPESFRDAMGIDPANYVSVTSFTHAPFYTSFPLELPDNWRWDSSYNVPVDELINMLENAILRGYTVEWAADVSPEKGSPLSSGLIGGFGVVSGGIPSGTDSLQAKRQADFLNRTLTDDHGMHIYGLALDQDGGRWFLVKNSWGDYGPFGGSCYISEDFMRIKTISFTVHRDALSDRFLKEAPEVHAPVGVLR